MPGEAHEGVNMVKQHIKPKKRPAPRPKRTVEVYGFVHSVMAGLSPAERAPIQAALQSAAAIRRLPVVLVVPAPSGNMYTARVTADQRLVYRIEPDRIKVVMLLSAGAVDYLRGTKVGSGSKRKPKS